MTSALIGLALILLIAVVTVALGALTRLLAARIIAPEAPADGRPLTPLERIALGNEIIARDLQPDDTHPVARTADRAADHGPATAYDDRPMLRQDLALRYPSIAAHSLR
ncbi:hypothetical protein CFK41_00500 [Brachybacterium ginsengisoli]|uniref:Uncharacterized protein n=1 Tax=Brachybacterium ginsengisoli TaxID=1331682 RepID=A0A291GTF2_9MICO|nr:hypothetical protein [Brachybacterium ginsengisoli]ATG53422.1 hypothetical protein CFK41_00500 [Brachybacterium ginsengisoli]